MICHDCKDGDHEPCVETMAYQDYASCDCQHKVGAKYIRDASVESKEGVADVGSLLLGGESSADAGRDSAHAEGATEDGSDLVAQSKSSPDGD